MNIWRRSFRLLLIASLFFLLAGCAEQKQIPSLHVKKGPPPEIIAKDGKAEMLPAGFIQRRLRLGIPSLEDLVIHDRQYIYITKKWFYEIIAWTEYFIRLQVPNLDLDKEYPLAFDGTFTLLASEIADISVAKKYNIHGSVLIGLVTAINVKPWKKIAGDGESHVYMIGLTSESAIIYDIRTRQSIELEKFPNWDSIKGIMF